MAHDNLSDGEKENAEMEFEDPDTESEEIEEESDNDDDDRSSRVYLPNRQSSSREVELECDESAYICYHSLKTGAPCLSFDIIPDSLGNDRADMYPLTMTLVGGTEVKKIRNNNLMVMKLSNMNRNNPSGEKKDDDSDTDSDDESDDESENANKPSLTRAIVHHRGCVNRIKVTTINDVVYAASWSELGKVHLWDLSQPISAVNNASLMMSYIQNKETIAPVFTFSGHTTEGFAMSWSPTVQGVLATGDCANKIHLWNPTPGGSWEVNVNPFVGHTSSVEDLQWSPTENNVLASCSVDKSIRIWDMRAAPDKACMLTKKDAHDDDVNVISWNKSDPFILSGGDDGKLRVWDLRQFPGSGALCTFKYHTAPITSVAWHPTDPSVFAASSADDVLSQWDLAVERDDDPGEEDSPELRALPPQLLFLHQGQKEIKELHWHRQMPGVLVSTGQSGLNVFRTLSI